MKLEWRQLEGYPGELSALVRMNGAGITLFYAQIKPKEKNLYALEVIVPRASFPKASLRKCKRMAQNYLDSILSEIRESIGCSHQK